MSPTVDQVTAWLSNHIHAGGRPVRGIVHAAGSVDDQLLVNTSEVDFAKVMASKTTGTHVLHDSFKDHDLEFFVMFGSAGSTIAAPGQGNYAAANAVLDAFAHYRQAQGLPALTIGWGPWSVGMVEELKLEKLYAQRGIELINPPWVHASSIGSSTKTLPTSSPSVPTGVEPAMPDSADGYR